MGEWENCYQVEEKERRERKEQARREAVQGRSWGGLLGTGTCLKAAGGRTSVPKKARHTSGPPSAHCHPPDSVALSQEHPPAARYSAESCRLLHKDSQPLQPQTGALTLAASMTAALQPPTSLALPLPLLGAPPLLGGMRASRMAGAGHWGEWGQNGKGHL